MKKLTFLFSAILLFCAISCSAGQDWILCEVSLNTKQTKGIEDLDLSQAKATEMIVGIDNSQSGQVVHREVVYFVKISQTSPVQYHAEYVEQTPASWWPAETTLESYLTDKNETLYDSHWFYIDPLHDIQLTLSQGEWAFSGVAFVLEHVLITPKNEDPYIEYRLVSEPLMMTTGANIHYINLNTRKVSVSMTPNKVNATLTFAYTTSTGFYAKTFIARNMEDLNTATTSYDINSKALTLEPGTYYVKTLVYENNTNNPIIFGDVASVFVYPKLAQRLIGRFDTAGKTGITAQNGESTSIEEVLNNPSKDQDLVLNNDIPLIGTPNDDDVGSPIFVIPNETENIAIDLAGNDMTISETTFRPSDVLFHIDNGKTLTLTNSLANGAFTNTTTSNMGLGNGNNNLGAVIAIDGGKVIMEDIHFKGSISGRASIGAFNFIGCYHPTASSIDYQPAALDPCRGGTIILKTAIVESYYGITNRQPWADPKNTTPPNPSVFGNKIAGDTCYVDIILYNTSFTNATSCINLNIADSNTVVRFVLAGTISYPNKATLFTLSGNATYEFYTDDNNSDKVPRGYTSKTLDNYYSLGDKEKTNLNYILPNSYQKPSTT